MLLAMPDVDELFPVELRVEAALELWLNSESSDSRVLNEFLDFVILDNCILEDCIDADTESLLLSMPPPRPLPTTTPSMLQPLLPMLVIDLFLHFLMGVGENEEMEEFELETGEDWLRGLVLLRLALF